MPNDIKDFHSNVIENQFVIDQKPRNELFPLQKTKISNVKSAKIYFTETGTEAMLNPCYLK